MESNVRWSGEWHIIDTSDVRKPSLESWAHERDARYFCEAVNDHEARCGRPRCYVVEQHAIHYRRGA